MAAEKNYEGIRLPLDLILIHDVESLEDALLSKYAVEHEQEIFFIKNDEDLQEFIEDLDSPIYYELDDIEFDRIKAVIDLLNRCENDHILSHIVDRIVR